MTVPSGTGASTSTSRSASSARTGPVAVSGVTEDPLGPPLGRLGVDQVLGLRAVGLSSGTTCTAVISGSGPLVAAAESL